MLKMLPIVSILVLTASSAAASAHGAGVADHDPASAIRLIETALVTAAVLAYLAGVLRIRREAGTYRVVTPSQTLAFAAAMSLFALILSPSIDEVSDALFSAHMAQHLVLILFIPPLLVWSRPLLVMIWGLPRPWRKGFATARVTHRLRSVILTYLMQPAVVAALFLGTFCFWHLPHPYAWSLSNEWIHAFEHLSFLLTAFMFWTLVIEPSGRRRMGHLSTMLYVAAIAVISGLPGALMILSPVVLFKAHGDAALAWGLTPIADQQIAGLIMWIPAGIFFLVPIAWLFLRSMHDAERRHGAVSVTLALVVCVIPAMLGACSRAKSDDEASMRAKALIGQYGCGTCHTIPGVDGATGRVGPPLAGIADRIYIAGRLQNSFDNMSRWITKPQAVAPGTAMPDMGVKPDEARTIAAYLGTLRDGN